MRSFKAFISEATIKRELPRNNDIVDPALMTFDEYYKLANSQDKFHSSDAYDWSLADMNKPDSYLQIADYPKLMNTFSVKGIKFELRAKVIDAHNDLQFAKTDPETGDYIYIDGKIQLYTPDELAAMGSPKYRYDFAIIEKDTNKFVGISQDEWGAILIVVAREYRGFGLGEILSKITREHLPAKSSGGFTSKGAYTFEKTHRAFVRDALTQGRYRDMLRDGTITKDRLQAILASARLDSKRPDSKIAFNSDGGAFAIDKSKWMLYSENNDFIIYDRRLKDHWNNDDLDDHWKDRFFIGMIYASTGYNTQSKEAFIHVFGGVDDQIKNFLLMLQLTDCKKHKEVLRLDEETLKLLDPSEINVTEAREHNQYLVTLKGKGINYIGLVQAEQRFRKSFDKYEEFGTYLAEAAYAHFED